MKSHTKKEIKYTCRYEEGDRTRLEIVYFDSGLEGNRNYEIEINIPRGMVRNIEGITHITKISPSLPLLKREELENLVKEEVIKFIEKDPKLPDELKQAIVGLKK